VAKRVVDRGNHKLWSKSFNVKLFIPKRSTKQKLKHQSSRPEQERIDEQENKPTEEKEQLQESPRTVRIRGMKKVNSRESVDWYFENKKRSGGGEIEEIHTDEEDDDVVYIRYKDSSGKFKLRLDKMLKEKILLVLMPRAATIFLLCDSMRFITFAIRFFDSINWSHEKQ